MAERKTQNVKTACSMKIESSGKANGVIIINAENFSGMYVNTIILDNILVVTSSSSLGWIKSVLLMDF